MATVTVYYKVNTQEQVRAIEFKNVSGMAYNHTILWFTTSDGVQCRYVLANILYWEFTE